MKQRHVFLVTLIFSSQVYATEPETTRFTLRDALDRALSNSSAMNKARADLKAAEAAISKVSSNFYPNIKVNASAGTFHDKVPVQGESELPIEARDRNAYTVQGVLTQPIFSGFSDLEDLKVARLHRDSSELALQESRTSTALDLIQLYFGIELVQKQLAAENETAALREKKLGEVRARMQNGRATELDLLKAEYELKSQVPQIKSLEIDREQKALKFARMLNIELTRHFELIDPLDSTVVGVSQLELPPLSEAYSKALDVNPSLKKVRTDISANEHDVGKARARHYPSVDLVMTLDSSANLRNEILTRDTVTYGGQLRVSWSMFTGLSSFREAEESLARLESLKENETQAREKLLSDLNDAYSSFKLAKLKVEAEHVNMDVTSRSIEKAQALYTNGRGNLSDVLDAYSNNLKAKKNWAQAIYDRVIALSKVKALIGGYTSGP